MRNASAAASPPFVAASTSTKLGSLLRMWNCTVTGAPSGDALTSLSVSRSEPGPVSAVLTTVATTGAGADAYSGAVEVSHSGVFGDPAIEPVLGGLLAE